VQAWVGFLQVDDNLERYVAELISHLARVLGAQIVGVYLHGSGAMDSFVPSRSDVDVLVVTRSSVSTASKRGVADALSESSLPCPGVGLELSIVTIDSVRDTSEAPSFELHLDTRESRVIDGADGIGDPDLISHFAMARERGLALVGPPAIEMFPSIDRVRLLRTFTDDLEWGIENDMGGYVVLNACRTLRYAREGALCSKPEAGEWALVERIGDPTMIDRALRRQDGEEIDVDRAEASAFVERVREELGAAT
jgi:hypothetical protein